MADLSLLLLTAFWGTTFYFVHGVLGFASPGLFLAARFGTALLVVGVIAAIRRDRAGPGLLRHGALLGLFQFLTYALQTVGLAYTTPSRSGFITGMSVLLVPFVTRFWLRRPVRSAAWAGVALAVVGITALTRPWSGEVPAGVRLGDALTAGCALTCALQIALTAEWAPRHSLLPLTALQLGVTFTGALLLTALEPRRLDLAHGAATFAATVAFTGVLLTAGASLVQNWAQARTTAVRAALIFALEPVGAALFSHFYGGEPLGPWDWLGGGLVVAGVVLGELGGAIEARSAPAA